MRLKYFVLFIQMFFIFSAFSSELQTQLNEKNNIARNYLLDHLSELGITENDINDAVIQNSYISKNNGLTHIYMRQFYSGIEVHNHDLQIHLNKDNSIFLINNNFIPNVSAKGLQVRPKIKVIDAIHKALNSLNSMNRSVHLLRSNGPSSNQAAVFIDSSLSGKEIPVKLVYELNEKNQLILAWDMHIQLPDAWWNIRVDAGNGDVIASDNWTVNEDYRVFPQPYESPTANGSSHQLVSNVADPVASPFGWHDTDGSAGAEFTDTRGNNVNAQDDLDANNTGGFRPDGGALLNFDFAFDENLQPTEGTNLEVGIVNLFYWNNVIHDILYQYGFDEVAGNFQSNNYGNGGSGNDAVNADAQDGSGNNNANFSTPPDGFQPRMQMFTFLAAPGLLVNTPASIAGSYMINGASFGGTLDSVGITGVLEQVNDNDNINGGSFSDACQPLIGFTAGEIALIDRGGCEFGLKVLNAQQAGAIAAMVINNQGDGLLSMGGGVNGGSVTIPSIFIGQTNGNTIRAELVNSVDITMAVLKKNRDGDLDNGIIIHEYGHGISNRLTGGPSNASCLGNDEQMGEGWSDFFALVLTAQSSETATTLRAMGTYAGNNTSGIREYPYTTDMTINLHTFADIQSVSIPHGVGSVWAEMLWEVYWNLIEVYGFDSDIYHGTGGNNIAMQLVIDGLKLQSCSPSFIQGRDAILAADVANNASVNQCAIWKGFAKRGLGLSASSGNSNTLGDETEAFDVPLECTITDILFKNGFE